MLGSPRARREITDDWNPLRLLVTSPEQAACELLRPIVLFGRPISDRARGTGMPERTLRKRGVEGHQALLLEPEQKAAGGSA